MVIRGVSIHAPVWGATWLELVAVKPKSFNPRTRVGCDISDCSVTCDVGSFNPRTRVGCDNHQLGEAWRIKSFNPRTRVGCDKSVNSLTVSALVSIHAPVWGATRLMIFIYLKPMVSIHAPVWGATHDIKLFHHFKSFNPRTRVGCDVMEVGAFGLGEFQSTHPCGVRRGQCLSLYPIKGFQSTHPCGVRRRAYGK